MTISAINSMVAPGELEKINGKQQITRDDFLKLLISQLQHQDPLKPLDNQEFASQLATFNSLEQLIGVNEKLASLQANLLQSSHFSATALIGKEIVTHGNRLNLKEGEDGMIRYDLGADAVRVVVNITNSKGDLVRVIELGNQKLGEQSVPWDGKDSSGKGLPAGVYEFEVNAFDAFGKIVPVSGRIQGVVSGVNLDGREPILELGDLRVPLSAVTAVR